MLAAVLNQPQMASMGEAVLFWIVAAVMVLGALGVLFFKKAAYAALSMVTVMLGLAVLYLAHGAPFMGIVQVVVYTGAIMMLFLFVLMMIGLQASDEYQQQRRSNIIMASVGGLILAAALGAVVWTIQGPSNSAFPGDVFSDEPVESLAYELFANHWFSMELAGALLITAAVGAVLLTHADRLTPRHTQRHVVEAKMAAYSASGRHVGQHTAPGVYARSTSPDVGALSGETGKPVTESIPRVLRVRGLDRSIGSIDPGFARDLQAAQHGDDSRAYHGVEATHRVHQSGSWGMAGESAPSGLRQLDAGTQPSLEAGSQESAIADAGDAKPADSKPADAGTSNESEGQAK
ncbi:MAG: NADH-quinone oxidoreductase subunit J [Actinomycetaceae bacterium]|nr:NADH-quinone oxidoreductase subunit J [Actinomycetaceae bacterium]